MAKVKTFLRFTFLISKKIGLLGELLFPLVHSLVDFSLTRRLCCCLQMYIEVWLITLHAALTFAFIIFKTVLECDLAEKSNKCYFSNMYLP